MMLEKIKREIENSNYWDARVRELSCNYFADEVKIVYEDENDFYVIYDFYSCYQVKINHVIGYEKDMPAKEYSRGQIPYFLQSVNVELSIVENVEFYKVNINMHPIEIEILCKDINVGRASL